MNDCMLQGKLYKGKDGTYTKTNYPKGNFGVIILKDFKGNNKINAILTVRPIKEKDFKRLKEIKG